MTATEAINRAFWMITVPSMVAMIGPWLVVTVLMDIDYLPSIGWEGFKWFLPVFVGGFVAGWLVWSIQVPRWRLLAYRQVDDLDELKAQAIARQIIWPEGHILERTEIASRRLRQEIQRVEELKSAAHDA